MQRRNRDGVGVSNPQVGGHSPELPLDRAKHILGIVDQVDLIYTKNDGADTEEGGNGEMLPGLVNHAVAGVDKQHHNLGGGNTSNRVAGVLDVAGRVRKNKRAVRGGKIPVGNINGDALLPLGAQTVDKQG